MTFLAPFQPLAYLGASRPRRLDLRATDINVPTRHPAASSAPETMREARGRVIVGSPATSAAATASAMAGAPTAA
ncbi:hypothetical protein [Acidilobus sp.]|uniref:hypothetical protein n=1 Tax=Acidilobus sp. TaxID=1872109 RepID=UPI003D0481D9